MIGELTLTGLRGLLLAGEITPREAIMLCRSDDEAVFARPMHDRALLRADYAADRIAEHSTRDTTGIPIAIEETLCVAGYPSPLGAQSYDATIVKKLDRYGALIVGALHAAPLGLGQSHCAERAVRSRRCLAALGAGVLPSSPLAQPVVALRPSFGTVSRYGLAVAAPSLKQIGIVALSARDAATVMDAISDFDPRDPAMRRPNCYNYAQDIGKEAAGLAIGVAAGTNFAPLKQLGCIRVDFALPGGLREAHAAIEAAEAVFALANAPDAVKGQFAQKLALGTRALNEGLYQKALALRGSIARALSAALQDCDALLVPLGGVGEPTAALAAELTGLPCIVRGESALIGRMCDEVRLLRLAAALEGGSR